MKPFCFALLACLVLGAFSPAATYADPAKGRDVASLLFGDPQWAAAPVGTTISYAYARKTYGSKDYGPSFDDTITVKLEPGENAQSRKVDVRMFSGANSKPAGPFETISTNPVLLLVFEDHLQVLAKLVQANPRYLKNAIRRAWREAATIEDVSLTVDGKTVPGTRITTHPFVNDPKADLMKGLDSLTYVVEIADSVPGEIVAIDIHAPADGPPKFSETLRYQAEKKP